LPLHKPGKIKPISRAYQVLSFTSNFGQTRLISSAEVEKLPSEASLYLFDGYSNEQDHRRLVPWSMLGGQSFIEGVEFHGGFLCITKPENASDRFYVNDLRPWAFDNRTRSVMLVSQWHEREERLSVRKIFTYPWTLVWDNAVRPALLSAMPGANIARAADPHFTWLAFPRRSGFSESRAYLVASQWVVIHASGIGMNAWLMFFLDLHVQGKHLKIDIVDFGYYVSPGTGQGQLMDALEKQKGSIMSVAQIFAGTLFSLIPSECDDVYLLPGDQTGARPRTPEIRIGNALDDVTIVLENPTTSPPPIVGVFAHGSV
jgi:hypothetical protein